MIPSRRSVLAWLSALPFLASAKSAGSAPKSIEGTLARLHMRAASPFFESLWYEDAGGNVLPHTSAFTPPMGAKYQVSAFTNQLTERWIRLNDDGTSTEIGAGNSGFSEELVERMVRRGWPLSKSIRLAANSCERCMNVLAHEFDAWDGGYPWGSEEWKRCGTSCALCEDVPSQEEE